MRTIWKYQLPVVDVATIDLPEKAKILTAMMRGESLCVWAEVDTEKKLEPRIIEIIGTGHTMKDGERQYISTVQMYGGGLIFHIYERLK